MELERIVGIGASTALIAFTCIGIPMQLRANHARRSVEGLSVWMVGLSWIAFALFTLLGAIRRPVDWYVLAGNAPGVVLLGWMLWQFWRYRDRGDADG